MNLELIKADVMLKILGDNGYSAELDVLANTRTDKQRGELAEEAFGEILNEHPGLDDVSELVRHTQNYIRDQIGMNRLV